MSATREDFCRELLDDDLDRGAIDPEDVAARFVRYFRVPGRPTMPVLKALLQDAGFGTVSGAHLESMKGVHFGARDGGYEIFYRQDLLDGAKEHTVLHETYEIICETLCEQVAGSPLMRRVCREADRFAAAVLMQPGTFSLMAETSGAGRVGPATGVPLLIRLSDAAARRGGERVPSDDGLVRARPR